MKLKEINTKNWKVKKNVKIDYNYAASIPKEEQECHFLIMKEGYNSDKSYIDVCCSHQQWITKLMKSKLFTVEKVLVSKAKSQKDMVLQVEGKLQIEALTIKKNKRKKMSDKKRAEFADRMHKILEKNKLKI